MKTPGGERAPNRPSREADAPSPSHRPRAASNRSVGDSPAHGLACDRHGGVISHPDDGPATFTRRDCSAALGLTLFASLLRLLFLLGSPDRAWPHSTLYEGDAPTWARWADALHRGQPFEFDLPVRTPGVAHLLSWLSVHGPGPSFMAWKVGWCLIASLGCGLFYLACRETVGRRCALIAASLWACSYGGLVLATSLNNETPYGTLIMAIVWLTLRAARRPAWWLIGALGVLHGAAMLLRAEHLLLLVLLEAWVWWRGRSGSLPRPDKATRRAAIRWLHLLPLRAATVGVIALLACMPWIIAGSNAIQRFNDRPAQPVRYELLRPRWTTEAAAFMESLPAFAREGNALYLTHLARQRGQSEITRSDVETFFEREFGFIPRRLARYHLVSLKGPLDFALANDPDGDGGFSKQPLIGPLTPEGNLTFGHPDHNRLVTQGYSVGWGWIQESPGAWLGLVVRKLTVFADGAAPGVAAYNLPLGRDGIRRAVDAATPRHGPAWWVWSVLTAGMLGGGVLIAAKRRCGGAWAVVILSKIIVTIAFYGYARQAMSIQPAFLFFMALAIERAWSAAGSRRPGWLTCRTVPAILLGGAILAGVTDAWRGRAYEVRPLDPRHAITPTPHWGVGAFESPDGLELQTIARRRSAAGE